jgi:hypothetical protein
VSDCRKVRRLATVKESEHAEIVLSVPLKLWPVVSRKLKRGADVILALPEGAPDTGAPIRFTLRKEGEKTEANILHSRFFSNHLFWPFIAQACGDGREVTSGEEAKAAFKYVYGFDTTADVDWNVMSGLTKHFNAWLRMHKPEAAVEEKPRPAASDFDLFGEE